MEGDRQRKWDIEQDCSTSSPKLIDSFLTGPSSIDRGVSSCRAVAYTDAHTALLQCSADTQCIIPKESRWLRILRRFIDGGALNLTFPKIYSVIFHVARRGGGSLRRRGQLSLHGITGLSWFIFTKDSSTCFWKHKFSEPNTWEIERFSRKGKEKRGMRWEKQGIREDGVTDEWGGRWG